MNQLEKIKKHLTWLLPRGTVPKRDKNAHPGEDLRSGSDSNNRDQSSKRTSGSPETMKNQLSVKNKYGPLTQDEAKFILMKQEANMFDLPPCGLEVWDLLRIDPTEKDNQFIALCQQGNLEALKELVQDREPPNMYARNGMAMREACMSGHHEIVRFLLDAPEMKGRFNLSFCDAAIKNLGLAKYETIMTVIESEQIKNSEHRKKIIKRLSACLARFGKHDVLEKLIENSDVFDDEMMMVLSGLKPSILSGKIKSIFSLKKESKAFEDWIKMEAQAVNGHQDDSLTKEGTSTSTEKLAGQKIKKSTI